MEQATERSSPAVAITNGIVALHRTNYGRGATKARTHIGDGFVLCVMEDIFTAAERTLVGAGKLETVRRARLEFQEIMRDDFVGLVENAVGRRVYSFFSQIDVNGNGIEGFLVESVTGDRAAADGAAADGDGTAGAG
ncbi:MAG TPA: Na-translocating system protein MpsC family protein [Gaiellaceae bacterium]|nr:Na-translocating system protein MpsC family protein [Gaiellaceae bacterium]